MSLTQRPGTRIQTAGHAQTPPADIRDSLFTAPLLLIGGWLFAGGWALAYPDTHVGNNVRNVDLVFATIILLNAIARVARTRGPGSDVITIVLSASFPCALLLASSCSKKRGSTSVSPPVNRSCTGQLLKCVSQTFSLVK